MEKVSLRMASATVTLLDTPKNAQPYLTSVSCAAGKKTGMQYTCSIIVCGLFVIV